MNGHQAETVENRKTGPSLEAGKQANDPRQVPRDFQVQRLDTALFGTWPGLQMQSGSPIELCPMLGIKEFADNGLDAADRAGRPGQVRVGALDLNTYLVDDQGDGIPADSPAVLAELFAIGRPMRSSKFWRIPGSRGQLGNGLRFSVGCVAASKGTIEITTRNQRVLLRPLPTGKTEIVEAHQADRPIGTRIVIAFGPELPEDTEDPLAWAQTAVAFAQPANGPPYGRRTSARWLDGDYCIELMRDIEPEETTVRQFLEQLDGCSGARAGQLAAPFGKNRTCRSMGREEVLDLLVAAQASARAVKPEALGLIGAEAFNPADCGYARQFGTFFYGEHQPTAEIPFAAEAWINVTNRKGRDNTGISVIANRSPITEDVCATRSYDGKRLALRGAGLSRSIELPRGDCDIVLHITSPLIPISSIGKRAYLVVFGDAIAEAIRLAFTKSRNRLPPDPEDPKPEPPPRPAKPPSHKSVVHDCLDEAIDETSEGGRYIFSQRNLFYRVRPYVEKATGGEALSYANFCSILTDYEAEHGEIPKLIRDARGSFRDLTNQIELGTSEIVGYERPFWQFHKVLFCEKEDHVRILTQASWGERHDCALMSSKGYASRAARDLVDMIADTAEDEPVTVFCIHDADASGTMIVQSLQEATRARNRRRIEIVDIGLQPWQAKQMELPVEDVHYEKRQPVASYVLAREDGKHWSDWLQHHRIELNAMTPGELIRWLDENVEQHGDLKVIPPADVAAARLRDSIQAKIRKQETERVMLEQKQAIEKAVAERFAAVEKLIPDNPDLIADIRAYVEEHRRAHWSGVITTVTEAFCFQGEATRLSPIRRRRRDAIDDEGEP
jgi:hypothetical protein